MGSHSYGLVLRITAHPIPNPTPYLPLSQSLTLMLQNEIWKNAAKAGTPHSIGLASAVARSPMHTPRYNDEGSIQNFEDWFKQGNPFNSPSGANDPSKAKQLHGGKALWKQVGREKCGEGNKSSWGLSRGI